MPLVSSHKYTCISDVLHKDASFILLKMYFCSYKRLGVLVVWNKYITGAAWLSGQSASLIIKRSMVQSLVGPVLIRCCVSERETLSTLLTVLVSSRNRLLQLGPFLFQFNGMPFCAHGFVHPNIVYIFTYTSVN